MTATEHVFLVPGFFGFDRLGDVSYFKHVEDALGEWARRRGIAIRVHEVRTSPTASLRRRAGLLLDSIAEATDGHDGGIHIIGHSTGGLDARLVVTPEVSLLSGRDPEPLARRVRTVVTVATPHQGTPVAGIFSSLLGQQLLAVLSLATTYVMRTGRLPADVLVQLAALFARPGPSDGGRISGLYRRLLDGFSSQSRERLEHFVDEIRQDQDLLPQIAAPAMDLFNASTYDRPGVRYGSVVTQAPRSVLRGLLASGLSPSAHASHALFLCISRLAARVPADRVPPLTEPQRHAMVQDFGAEPDRHANDGIVPTRSQPWGQVIRGVWADHLDVIGHFQGRAHVPPHFDWLTSGSNFTRARFLGLWDAIARFTFVAPTDRVWRDEQAQPTRVL